VRVSGSQGRRGDARGAGSNPRLHDQHVAALALCWVPAGEAPGSSSACVCTCGADEQEWLLQNPTLSESGGSG